ncbi:MAG: NAD-dependent deacylase [Bacteroidia bacterium]|nr:NAD-dependent deacylase [Bacteroidia bacterium]HQV00162.1 NAD-dependent deacylase [Bacteroidia bacterium]
MKKIVVFTGAGISAESGIKTFRDSGGLWEQHKIEDVATPEAWFRNQKLVLDFYNQRRKNVLEALPNVAHNAIAELQYAFDVHVITQNIDDLHERAGSKKVLHLHGEIIKARSTVKPNLIYPINGWELKEGDTCELGSQLRPHIVWFGEPVPLMETAAVIASSADVFIVIGTSLEVYPAASLIDYVNANAVKYLIDPNAKSLTHIDNLQTIRDTACNAVPPLIYKLLENVN